MPLIRSDRSDRRRRVMREAVAADAEVAVESVRARQRRRAHESESSDDLPSAAKRDPGYSQAVRRACQQRLVQLIPVRKTSLVLTIAGLWLLWTLLMLAHYFVYVHPIGNFRAIPVAYLLHVRSTHGIAHWLGGQLWMLTALASLMIFQLRRHKLDDYRAKYRVWGLLACAALVSSLDASSSGLFLLGMSIDGWARREIGYSGWSLVLSTFATLVGLLGLRICSEIKTAPMSVTFWLGGLIAWAFSALIGTELMVSPWDKTMTDLVVGGAWLGGILSVFLAAGIYLRHIYIQAQKRFILRNGLLAQRRAWKLPRFARRDRSDVDDRDPNQETENEIDSAQDASLHSTKSWLPWKRQTRLEKTVKQEQLIPGRKNHRNERDESDEEDDEVRPASQRNNASRAEEEVIAKRRWLRLPRWKSDPRLGEDYSDVSAERRKRDEGFEEPFGKKAGWFSKKSASSDRDSSTPDFEEIPKQARSWFKRPSTSDVQAKKPTNSELPHQSSEESKKTSKRRWFQRSSKKENNEKPISSKPKTKRSWGLLKKKSSDQAKPNTSASQPSKSTSEKPKRKLFGFFDKLKLKPPAEGTAPKSGPIPVNTNRSPVPSSSSANRNDSARPESNYHSSRPVNAVDEDDYDDDSNRTLSKAERKRLRRQQQENRRAA